MTKLQKKLFPREPSRFLYKKKIEGLYIVQKAHIILSQTPAVYWHVSEPILIILSQTFPSGQTIITFKCTHFARL